MTTVNYAVSMDENDIPFPKQSSEPNYFGMKTSIVSPNKSSPSKLKPPPFCSNAKAAPKNKPVLAVKNSERSKYG